MWHWAARLQWAVLLCLQKKAILTTIGVLEEPLGNARLHGARLMAALLHTNTPSITQELCRLDTMGLLLVSRRCCHLLPTPAHLVCLAHFTEHNVFKVRPCGSGYQSSLPFYD